MRGGRSGRSGSPVPDRRAALLLAWFDAHRRPLPWRADLDPYRRWVAEVLLQQTRVEQARPYFDRFVAWFPSVGALARAPREAVLRVWQGAGYYARARHLHDAARQVAGDGAGVFPRGRDAWATLPGVGPYIAAALASQVDGEAVVAMDANVARVASRWFLETGDVRSARVRARLAARLATFLPRDRPGAFNEALMELGETICRPTAPSCPDCPVRRSCRAARELDDPGAIPRRPPSRPKPHVRAAVVVVERGGRWWMQRRPDRGFLGGLWEFPGGKIEPRESPEAAARRELAEETGLRVGPLRTAGIVRHAYSHFSVDLHVFVGAAPASARPGSPGRWVAPGELGSLPIARGTGKIVSRIRGAGTVFPGSGSDPGRTRRGPPLGGEARSGRSPRQGRRASTARSRVPR